MHLSLLDRLTGNEDSRASDLDPDSLQYLRLLKESLCRDMSALLNTRRASEDFDPSFEQATNSLLTFGVVDFTSFNLTSGPDQERVRCSVERAIRQFEPRLTSVSVSIEEPTTVNPALHFNIDAALKIGAGREPVSFAAVLSRASRRIAVSGAER